MVSAALLVGIAAGCLLAAALLRRAAWPLRGPHAAVATWQALGLTWGFATVGALLSFGLLPYGGGVFRGAQALSSDLVGTAGGPAIATSTPSALAPWHAASLAAGVGLTLLLLCALLFSGLHILRTRRRHRDLLHLVSRDDPKVPGARVVDHPAAAAYCLPGVMRSQVVISAGALKILDCDELEAVLAHEHAHLRHRHDLVLLPFSSLKRAFPGSRFVVSCYDAVALLVELCADERARRQRSPRELATALMRFGSSPGMGVPSGALAALPADRPEPDVVTRVTRLLSPAAKLPLAVTLALLSTAPLLPVATMGLWHAPY